MNIILAELLQDILAALATVANGVPQALLALSYGFASVPTGLAFLIGAAACGITASVVPVSFQAESIVLAGTMGKDKRERTSMIIWAALLTLILGLAGIMGRLIDFTGGSILSAMMAGVGIMLAKVALDSFKTNKLVTVVSIAAALSVYFFISTELIWVVLISMAVSSVVSHLAKQKQATEAAQEKAWRFKLVRPTISPAILRGALGLSMMTIGGNIAYGSVTASMADGATLNVDHLTIYSGLADLASSLFGGVSVEAIISATATAPQPVLAAVLMQLIMAAILLFGLLPKLARYIPAESISGFLFILGAFVTAPGNAQAAFAAGDPGSGIVAAVTMIVTAIFDPFSGMVAGIVLRALFAWGLGL